MTVDSEGVSPKGWYNTKQAAEALGIDRTTLYRWVMRGWIEPHVRPKTGRKAYRGKDIIKLINDVTTIGRWNR